MAYINSRPTYQQPIPQRAPEAPAKGWLRNAAASVVNAVKEAVSGPQMVAAPIQGPDTYSDEGRRDLNAPRSLNKLCSTGRGGGSKVLTAISNEYYVQLCNEISNYSDPTSTRSA